jgi:membrane protein DedA with SNARE-associated domain/membrane-associated phospholipid phosphatase
VELPKEKRGWVRLGGIAAIVVIAVIAYQVFVPDIDVEQLLEDLSTGLGAWTYALVGVLAFLETGAFVGLVFPGETAVILGGAVAGQGATSIVITIAIVWFCAWLGDTTSFWVGRRLGRDFVLKHGPKVRITHERFEQVERYFDRHGGKTILIGRFIGLVRALAPFIAGSSGMRYAGFVPFSVLGTGLWAAAFSLLGYVLSQSLDKATQIAGTGALVFGSVVAVVVAMIVISRYLRKPENRRKLAERIQATPGLRRILPQLRFLWHRLTPGGLGLEFTSLIATLSVSLYVFVGYAIVVTDDPGPTPGDAQAIDVASSLRTDWLVDISKVFTELGSTPITLAVAVAAGIVLVYRRHWPEALVLVGALVICHVAVPVVKELIDRPRPPDALIATSGDGYPSGHATYSVIYTWLALTIAIRVRRGWTYGSVLIAGGIALTGLVGLSRVYLGAHYLSDVSGGWGLGVSAFAGCAVVAMILTHMRMNRVAKPD